MKVKEIPFKRPRMVFQVFRNINIYDKSKKSLDDRKDKLSWNTIQSYSGYVINDELHLPEQILKNPDFKVCDLITLSDDNHPQVLTPQNSGAKAPTSSYNHCLSLIGPNKFEIFEIKKAENLELHLRYDPFEIGIPERKNFKLCDLKKNKPVEIKINGKTDFSMASRRARVFKEQAYIIEYLGGFDKCKILKTPFNHVSKNIPTKRKVVDLLKPLW